MRSYVAPGNEIKINGPALKARNSISALQASTLFLMCLTRGDALRACPWLLYCAPSALALAPAFYSTPSALRSHLFSIPRLRRFALAPRIGIVLAHTSHLHVSRQFNFKFNRERVCLAINPFRVHRRFYSSYTQGSRCARTLGLKLANAFGVLLKLTPHAQALYLHTLHTCT